MAQSTNQEVKAPGYLTVSKVMVWVMYFWVTIGIVALTLRIFLLAFSANLQAGFANFVMEVSGDYLEPFRNIFPGRDLTETGYLDTSAIFAIIVYMFIAWGFKALIDYIQNKIDVSTAEQRAKIKAAEK